MLNSILIENFKSYKSQRLPLASLTLMIGANASGKTNAIEAFRFLSWVVGGEKLSTIKNRISTHEQIFRGDVRDLVYKGKESFTLGAEVAGCNFRIEIGDAEGELLVKQERLFWGAPKNKSIYTMYKKYPSRPNTAIKQAVISIVNTHSETGQHIMADLMVTPDKAALPFVLNLSFNAIKRENEVVFTQMPPDEPKAMESVLNTLSNVLFFDLIPSEMRGDSYPEARLLNTGANLAGVLHTLWQQPDQQGHILEFIQSLPEQDIKELKFYTDHRGRVELALIETFGNQDQEQYIELLSDGTLRVLAIAAALLSAPEGSTVVIEEVDNGVHPSRAKQLLTTMREHAERRNLRLLLSTHNPALMDALPDEALGDVVFCYRDPKDGDSRLVRLSDLDDYMGLVMQGSLGQLVTRGIVDRFVKHPVTPEEKKQKALDWLAMMQGDDE